MFNIDGVSSFYPELLISHRSRACMLLVGQSGRAGEVKAREAKKK
jgi:hypothetical protein